VKGIEPSFKAFLGEEWDFYREKLNNGGVCWTMTYSNIF
jgi:hypothetical protein